MVEQFCIFDDELECSMNCLSDHTKEIYCAGVWCVSASVCVCFMRVPASN